MPLLRPPLRAEGRERTGIEQAGAPNALKKGDHLYLIDGSGYLFRAYHALPPLTRKSDGLPVGAVSGYCNMMWKLLEDMKGGEQPTHLAVVFDAGAITFRNKIYDQYKANRPPAPEDLIPQFPLVRDATRAFGVSCVEEDGLRGRRSDRDLCAAGARGRARVTIVSSDKDLMQLVVDGKVELLDTMKNKRIGSAEVMEKFGVPPSKVIEVQALAGDSADNVPGVRGIGVKTAAELINQYGDLETLLKRAGEIKQPKRRETSDRECRECAHLQETGDARRSCAAARRAGAFRGARARAQDADRVPEGDGIQHHHQARGGAFRHRGHRCDRRGGRTRASALTPKESP